MNFCKLLMSLICFLTLTACYDRSNSGSDNSAVVASPSEIALILSPDSHLHDAEIVLTLTNQGNVPTNLTLTHLTNLTLSTDHCDDVPANGSCQITLSARSGVPDKSGSIVAQNSRGASVTIPITIGTPSLTSSGASINHVGSNTVTLTNPGIVPVTFNNLALIAGSSQLDLGNDTCGNAIAPQASCTVQINAPHNSAGSALLKFNGGDYDAESISLTVIKPTVQFQNFLTQAYDNFYLESNSSGQDLYVENSGPFDVQNLQMTLSGMNSDITVLSDACSGNTLTSDARCKISYRNAGSAIQFGTILANASNIRTTPLAVNTGAAVIVTAMNPANESRSARGLSFLELQIQNTLTSGAITALSITSDSNMVIVNDAQHPNSCGASLAQGSNCTFWLKALSDVQLGEKAQVLQLHYTPADGSEVTKNTSLILTTDLYLAGHFKLQFGTACYTGIDANGNPTGSGSCNNFTRFDGTHWYQAGLGDLNAWSGQFSDPTIRDLLFGADGRIYVEGNFPAMNLSGADHSDQACASYVAAWDGTAWDNLASNSGTDSSACDVSNSRLAGPISPMNNAYYLPGGPGAFSQIDFLAFDANNNALFFNNVTTSADGDPLIYRYILGESTWNVIASNNDAQFAFTNTMTYDADHDSLYLAGAYNDSQDKGQNVLMWTLNNPGVPSSNPWTAFDPFGNASNGLNLSANSLFQSGNTLYSYYATADQNSVLQYHFASCSFPLGAGNCQTYVLQNFPTISSLTGLDANGNVIAVGLAADEVNPIVSALTSGGLETDTLGTDDNSEMVSNAVTVGNYQYLVGTFKQLGGVSGLACMAERSASGTITAVSNNRFDGVACTGGLYNYTKNAIFGEAVVPSLQLGSI